MIFFFKKVSSTFLADVKKVKKAKKKRDGLN